MLTDTPHLRLLLCAALWLCGAASARPATVPATVTGTVSQVIDGESLRLSPPDQPSIVVRLQDIDVPASCQPGGVEAQLALREWVLYQPATLRKTGIDRDGRTIGTLLVGGRDIGQRMVEEGHAWSVRGRNGHGPLLKSERVAKALARGLHAQAGAVMPSEFRRLHGPCGKP